MIPELITAVAALVAAVGGIIAAVLSYRSHVRIREAEAEIVATKDGVFELGKQVDGRLSELLRTTEAAAHALGVTEGVKAERDRPK